MVEAVTAQEMQRFDRYTMEEIGVPALVLMERAAMATIEVLAAGTFGLMFSQLGHSTWLTSSSSPVWVTTVVMVSLLLVC